MLSMPIDVTQMHRAAGQRLKEEILNIGSVAAFARLIGVPASMFYKYFKGEQNLGKAMQQKLSNYGIDITYVVTGERVDVLDRPTSPAMASEGPVRGAREPGAHYDAHVGRNVDQSEAYALTTRLLDTAQATLATANKTLEVAIRMLDQIEKREKE